MSQSGAPGPVLVIGETLIDIAQRPDQPPIEHVGGSPANVALGLARLDHPTWLATTVGLDARGERVREHLAEGGVRLQEQSAHGAPTSIARAEIAPDGSASYDFELVFSPDPIDLPPATAHIHTGSLGAIWPGSAPQVSAVLRRARAEGVSISYDPNLRPGALPVGVDAAEAVARVIATSDIVKASDEDVALLHPGQPLTSVAWAWCAAGAGLVVITSGAKGVSWATAVDPSHIVELPSSASQVVDTIGAGDSFTAGLISGLLDLGYAGSPAARDRLRRATAEDVEHAIRRGLATSGVTVGRAGAYAPTRAEIG
ncbi:PfkB family carbohydrate kinase [Janibacter sp. GXQ6167]|uniref:PfkB family carbohydrate kinase n=1 Tax=Janibacter sp. GXQ6167 TaxID=3240791 RepID=UPI003525F2A8